MLDFWRPGPVQAGTLAIFMIGCAAMAVAIGWKASNSMHREPGAKRSGASWIGFAVQGLAFFIPSGPLRVEKPWFTSASMPAATATGILMAVTLVMFVWSARTMGRNWAIVARTRSDHELVTHGPFAWVRNPIYLAMGLWIIGEAVASGRLASLWLALPVYLIGTMMRVREEEALLRAHFGRAYDDYAARVKRLVPGLF